MLIDRTIHVFGEIDIEMAREITSKIDLINEYDEMMVEEEASILSSLVSKGVIDAKAIKGVVGREPIYLEINSNGGETSAGYSIITAIENSATPIIGYVTGNCMSMAVAILASCRYRLASEYSEFMIHDVYSGMQGKYSDLNSTIEYIKRVRNNYNKVLVKYTNLTEEDVNKLVDKNSDHYFSPFDAKDMGIIDNVDIDTVDENTLYNKLYGDDKEDSYTDEGEENEKEEVVDELTKGEDSDSRLTSNETSEKNKNLEMLEDFLGFKLD